MHAFSSSTCCAGKCPYQSDSSMQSQHPDNTLLQQCKPNSHNLHHKSYWLCVTLWR